MIDSVPQIVVRIDATLITQLDDLVASGAIQSRSQGVRVAIEQYIDQERRAEIGRQIVEGYLRIPQEEDDGMWSDELTRAMIAEEPW